MKIGGDNPELGEYACISTGGEGNEEMDRISGVSNQKRPLFVHFFIILIQQVKISQPDLQERAWK